MRCSHLRTSQEPMPLSRRKGTDSRIVVGYLSIQFSKNRLEPHRGADLRLYRLAAALSTPWLTRSSPLPRFAPHRGDSSREKRPRERQETRFGERGGETAGLKAQDSKPAAVRRGRENHRGVVRGCQALSRRIFSRAPAESAAGPSGSGQIAEKKEVRPRSKPGVPRPSSAWSGADSGLAGRRGALRRGSVPPATAGCRRP